MKKTEKKIDALALKALTEATNKADHFPILFNSLLRQKFIFRPYAYAIEHFGYDREKYVSTFGDAFAFYDEVEDCYCIFYNEKCSDSRRLNWHIVHEIGHIEACHLNKRDFISKSVRTADLEKEAEYFSHSALAPDIILDAINLQSQEELFNICYLPEDKSQIKYQNFRSTFLKRSFFKKTSLEAKVLKQFEEYIEKYNQEHNSEFSCELCPCIKEYCYTL